MHQELPFRIIFVGIYVIGFILRWYSAANLKKAGEKLLPDKQNMRHSSRFRIVFQGTMSLVWIGIVVSYAWYPAWMAALKFPLPLWLRYSGVLLGFVSFPLLLATFHALGRYWTPLPQIREKHELVTSGPYRFIRHPMYSTMIMLFIAFPLISANILVALSSLAAIAATIGWAMKEEKMLTGYFGNEYREYMKQAGAFLPRIKQPTGSSKKSRE